MDEAIEAMRTLWTEEVATYQGKYVRFEAIRCDPRPTNGSVPLHIGGASPAAIRRAAKYGDGYFPWVGPGLDLHETLGRVVSGVRSAAEDLGRDPSSIEITVGGARTVAEAERLVALGVDRLVIAVRSKETNEVADELAQFGQTVIGPTRDL
jgi:alkanesulfonate monooxygenase SsuD/methylene tetrahydromethanopterin reductase-like flavin-dependent oxidoreductase (luciferase family)